MGLLRTRVDRKAPVTRSCAGYHSRGARGWRKLQQKCPAVCTEADIEALFGPVRAVDLYYDVVRSSTEWPTRDFSIKTLAKFPGFEWRNASPSCAASIEWFDQRSICEVTIGARTTANHIASRCLI
jgi:predicted RecB family nuclease